MTKMEKVMEQLMPYGGTSKIEFSQLFELLDKYSKMYIHGIGHCSYIFRKHQLPHLAYEELCNLEVVSITPLDYCGEACIDVEVK